MKLGKIFFISYQKLFSLSRKSSFRILDIVFSWRYQMPRHKTRNIFYWMTSEVNTICSWNLFSLRHITKQKTLSKSSTQTATWKLVLGPFVFVKD